MEDREIVERYWQRDRQAISCTAQKYGRYCHTIAYNILGDREDAEECVNDTYVRAWDAMPPHRPQVLSAFLGKITRNLSLNRYRQSRAGKRGGGEIPLVLEELGECVSGGDDPAETAEYHALTQALNDFLASLPLKKRNIFLQRYWHTRSVREIAAAYEMREGAVSMLLCRVWERLSIYLRERGFTV